MRSFYKYRTPTSNQTILFEHTYGMDAYFEDWLADTYNSLNNVKINDSLISSVQSMNLGGYSLSFKW